MGTDLEEALRDYVEAEDALRAFTDRNFGRLCAMCARWTLLAAQSDTEWRLSSWVTNCCNANHALESMSEESLAGIVASREAGRQWWNAVRRAPAARCSALTDSGCALQRGRPELCNRYFCEAVRDYLWHVGGERNGARLAERLDEMQRRWSALYGAYQRAADRSKRGEHVAPVRVREEAGTRAFLALLDTFDAEIAATTPRVSAGLVAQRLFKVSGEPSAFEPFFEREVEAIGGQVRYPG